MQLNEYAHQVEKPNKFLANAWLNGHNGLLVSVAEAMLQSAKKQLTK